jgi:transposase
MQTITTIGLDIAKSVFQVHGVDAQDNVGLRRQLKRRSALAFFQKLPSCLIGIEACAFPHHWSRELQALGHTVRLMPPAYVKSPPSNRTVSWVFMSEGCNKSKAVPADVPGPEVVSPAA